MKSSVFPLGVVASFLLVGFCGLVEKSRAVVADKNAAQEKLAQLGPLKDDLDLWLDMDSRKDGGIAWARHPVKITISPEVETKSTAEHRWMDFRQQGAVMKFAEPYQIGKFYTLCTWMEFPAPKKHALVWQGAHRGGAALFVTDTGMFGWSGAREETVSYAKLPADLKGWHHVAVTCDGKTTCVFLDGRQVAAVEEIVASEILSIGNHWQKDNQSWMMCGGLDSQLIFHRPLTPEEVRKAMEFGSRSGQREAGPL